MFFKKISYLDLRSLALFRICLGCLVLVDVIFRSMDLTAHYSDVGILPRSVLIEKFLHVYRFSFYLFSGNEFLISLLFFIHGILAVFLILGIRTHLIVFFVWLLQVSLVNRNLTITNIGDYLFCLLLFWGMFLPLGDRFSVETTERKKERTFVRNPATIAYILQICTMYMYSAVLKNHPIWNKEFNAIYFVFSLDFYTTALSRWLVQYPLICKVLTFKTLVIEFFGPILLFIPYKVGVLRGVVIFLFFALHIGIILTIKIGLFPWVCLAAWIPLLPSEFWEFLNKKKFFLKWSTQAEKLKCHFLPRHRMHFFITERLKLKKMIQYFVLCNILVMVLWSFTSTTKIKLPKFIANYALMFRLEQSWGMFAPFPLVENGWYVMDGKLIDGTSFDPFLQIKREASFERPKDFEEYFSNNRWRRYFLNLNLDQFAEYRLYFGRYLCRINNLGKKDNNSKLSTFKIYYMRERNLNIGERAPVIKTELWTHTCF